MISWIISLTFALGNERMIIADAWKWSLFVLAQQNNYFLSLQFSRDRQSRATQLNNYFRRTQRYQCLHTSVSSEIIINLHVHAIYQLRWLSSLFQRLKIISIQVFNNDEMNISSSFFSFFALFCKIISIISNGEINIFFNLISKSFLFKYFDTEIIIIHQKISKRYLIFINVSILL